MAKFIFIVPPLDGHINPTLSLGNELLKRGHEVAWIGFDPSLVQKLPTGGEFIPILNDINPTTIENYIQEMKSKSAYGLESLKFLYEEVLIPLNQFMLDNGLIEILNTSEPDIIITDHQMFCGVVAAIKLNIPYVTSVTAPTSIKPIETLPKLEEWIKDHIVNFQKQNGIDSDERLDCSQSLVLVYTSRLMMGNTHFSENYRFIGPVISERSETIEFDWDELHKMGDLPCILVSIGTTFDHTQKSLFFKKVIAALKDQPVRVIVISDPDLLDEIPANFIVRKRVPQLQLLEHMQLVICHGGQNTVNESLSDGIPLIILPIAYDQSQVAQTVSDLKAGIRLNFNRFKPDNLKEAVHSILSDEEYKNNAKKIQISFKDAGGVKRGVDCLEELYNKSKVN